MCIRDRWQAVPVTSATPSGYCYVEYTTYPAGSVFAASNLTGPVSVPFGAFGSTTYLQYAFAEAAVNLYKVIDGINRCSPIATVLIKTKASDALGAELKDMIQPIQVNINRPPLSLIHIS